MFEELKYIELSGEKYPVKCDMVVLEKIQDEFGSLEEFEKRLRRGNRSWMKQGKR